ncbi:MAG: hypothetical protein IJW67_09225 [Blautia sp.]|nr:hypothetical protein [Blautia sp.]
MAADFLRTAPAWLGYAKALKEGKKECEEIPNATTLAISHIMNTVFQNAQIEFPF